MENRCHTNDRQSLELSKTLVQKSNISFDYRDNRTERQATLPKNNKNGNRIGGQTRTVLILESSKYLQNEWECVIGYIKMFVFKICSRRKNYLKA